MNKMILLAAILCVGCTAANADVKDILKPVDTSHLDNLPCSSSGVYTRLNNGDIITDNGIHYMKVGKDYIGSNGTSYLKTGHNHYTGINTPDIQFTRSSSGTYYGSNGNIYQQRNNIIIKY